MTREEAIKILKAIRAYECYPKSASEETKEAIDTAIEALNNSIQMSNIQELQAENGFLKEMVKFYRERPTHPLNGEWIKHEIEDTCRWVECSECHKEYPNIDMNFCPNCGKRMIGNEKQEENNDVHNDITKSCVFPQKLVAETFYCADGERKGGDTE